MTLVYRTAKKEEAPALAHLMSLASGGVVEFFLHDLIKNMPPIEILSHVIAMDNSSYSYKHHFVAVSDENVVGLINTFTLKEKNESQLIPQTLSLSFLAYLKWGWRYFQYRHLDQFLVKDSLYINSLSVLSETRGQGLGKELIQKTKLLAKERNIFKLSLDMWADNEKAHKFYESLGFKVIQHLKVKPNPYMNHKNGILTLACEIN